MAWAIYVSIVLVFSDCFERKGSEILKYYYLRCRKGYTQHAHMYSLSPPSLSLFLSLPVSLSFCETEFYCCTPGWTGIHYVIQTQLANLLPQPVERWDCRCLSPHPAHIFFFKIESVLPYLSVCWGHVFWYRCGG